MLGRRGVGLLEGSIEIALFAGKAVRYLGQREK